MDQANIDNANAEFWNELCGTSLAQAAGVRDRTAASLAQFDAAYLALYPYLASYLPWHSGERTLEIGLGYGTVGQLLASRGLDYHGLDISPGPVAMMAHRLRMLGLPDAEERATQGSALNLPFGDETFDAVVSVGCLHHTGDLAAAVSEVRRVLRSGGHALVMVYNRRSYRHALTAWRGDLRGRYDYNSDGTPAPSTQFVSTPEAKLLFTQFSTVKVTKENWGYPVLRVGRLAREIRREWFLGNLAHLAGLDLYISATR